MDRPNADPADAPAGDDTALPRQLFALVRHWLRVSREANAARIDASIDRASFESFPASDPVAPAVATGEHEPSLAAVDCTLTPGELVFRLGPRGDSPDALRPPPAFTIEGDTDGDGRLRLCVWVDDVAARDTVPAALELEPVHASIRARQHERRSGVERRSEPRTMPAGFDRRVAERRGAAADLRTPG